MSQRSACSVLGSRWLGILVPAAIVTFGLQGPASAQEIAESLLVDLDARNASAGEPVWENQAPDTIGDFIEVGDAVKGTIDGVPAVTFNATAVQDAYQSEADTSAAPGLYGVDATASIEAWVYNPDLVDEETILAWAWRGGPIGTNMSFNYGVHATWGAVGHWDWPDLAWNNAGGAPAAGQWHHLVYTFDGLTQRVYSDGVEANFEDLPAGTLNINGPSKITIAAQNNDSASALEYGLRGTLSIAKVRIHDGALTAEQVQSNYDLECPTFCTPEFAPECATCPSPEDFVYKGKGRYVRLLQLKAFPAITAATVVEPAGATVGLDGRLDYAIPSPEPNFFNVAIDVTNDVGTTRLSWKVTLVDPPLLGDIEVAEELLVSLQASDPTAGTAGWLNAGTLGDFLEVGDPVPANLGSENSPAVDFNPIGSADAYVCADPAPEGVVGIDPTRSIEVWAFNPAIADEETLVAWGMRGGGDGTNMSFNYGTNGSYGAVGQWGAGPDIGWNNAGGAPDAGLWHHLVYTYDGTTTRVYADGILANQEVLGAAIINTHAGTPIALAAQWLNLTVLNAGLKGSLALGGVRVHDGVLTLAQIRNNFELERGIYGLPPITPEAPTFLDAPAADAMPSGAPTYTRKLTFTGYPDPTLEVLQPAGGTITPDGVFSYTLPSPEPDSFTVEVVASNGGGDATATWVVTIVKPAVLTGPPVHRYEFTADASDSIGGADGVPLGDVLFENGLAVLNNDLLPNSNATGQSPPAAPPGAYIDLPNGIISSLGTQATFETWATWDGPVGSAWQRIFDFGRSVGGEDWSNGGTDANSYYLFLTPYSGAGTLRFGFRQGKFPATEKVIDTTRMAIADEQHIVVVWDETAGATGTASMYVNGLKVAETALLFKLADLVDKDLNNWLGRSQFPDTMFDGSYNEFRIYDYALTPNQVLGDYQKGPDVVNTEGGGGGTKFVRGNANADAVLNITDGIYVLNFLFLGGPAPPCAEAANANGDATLNITDGIYILNFLFLGGPQPTAPYPDCGEIAEVDCASFPPCNP